MLQDTCTNMLCISCANIKDEIERRDFLVETPVACVDATFTRCGAFFVLASEIAFPMNMSIFYMSNILQ